MKSVSQIVPAESGGTCQKPSYWARLRQLADKLDKSWCDQPSYIENAAQQLIESIRRELKLVARIKKLLRELADRDRRIAELEAMHDLNVAADRKVVTK